MVLADGKFDPIHVGHLRYLRAAAEWCAEGEPFVVRVASDDEVRAAGRTPFQTPEERWRLLNALVPCGMVVGMSLPRAIAITRPRLLIKGADWKDRLPEEVIAACVATGTAMAFTQTQERTSTERLSSWT